MTDFYRMGRHWASLPRHEKQWFEFPPMSQADCAEFNRGAADCEREDFGPQWLEEDCEACLVYLRWPGFSTDEQIADSIQMAKVVSSWQHCTRWNRVVDWLKTTMLHERAESHAEAVKLLWQSGSMSTSGNGWTVSFRRCDERREVCMKDYPAKRYYTDAELDAMTPPTEHRSVFSNYCVGTLIGDCDLSPSDADPGL